MLNAPWQIGSIRPPGCSWIEGSFLLSIQHLQLDRRQLFTFYSAFAAGQKVNFPLVFSLHSLEISSEILKKSVSSSVLNQFTIKVSQIKDISQQILNLSGPTVKFCLDHPHKLLQIFLAGGRAGRFGLVNPGHPSKYSPICLFSGDTLKIVIDSAKKKIQTFLYIEIFRGVLWTTFYTNSPWCNNFSQFFLALGCMATFDSPHLCQGHFYQSLHFFQCH